MSSLTLFGASGRGVALSAHLAAAGREVTLWSRRSDIADTLQRTRRHPEILPELSLPETVHVTADLQTAAEASSLWGMAVPTVRMREVAEQLLPFVHDDVIPVSLAKGFERETRMTMSQVLNEAFGVVPPDQIGALHGPSHAEEIVEAYPTTIVAAAPNETVAEHIQETFMTKSLRVYSQTDIIGVEVGGAAKHIIAIATGISDSVGYGDNIKSLLITRGLAEIRRLGVEMGGRTETFSGLTGFGDLIGTCISAHSHNHAFGKKIGQGRAPNEVRAEMDVVVEGVPSLHAAHALAEEYELEMPITTAVYGVVAGDRSPSEMVDYVVDRSAERENWLPKHLQDAASKSTFSTPLSPNDASAA